MSSSGSIEFALPAVMAPSLEPMPSQRTSPEEAGKKFEGLFASMLIKQMRQSLNSTGLFGKDPSDILGGLFDNFMGQYMSQHGSLGIARMMQAQLEKRGDPT